MEAAGALSCSRLCACFFTLSSSDLDLIVHSCVYASISSATCLNFSGPMTPFDKCKKKKKKAAFLFLFRFWFPAPLSIPYSHLVIALSLPSGENLPSGGSPLPRAELPSPGPGHMGPLVACRGGKKMILPARWGAIHPSPYFLVKSPLNPTSSLSNIPSLGAPS